MVRAFGYSTNGGPPARTRGPSLSPPVPRSSLRQRGRRIVRQLLPDGVDAIFDLAGGDGLRAVADLLVDREKLISVSDPAAVDELGGHMIA